MSYSDKMAAKVDHGPNSKIQSSLYQVHLSRKFCKIPTSTLWNHKDAHMTDASINKQPKNMIPVQTQKQLCMVKDQQWKKLMQKLQETV